MFCTIRDTALLNQLAGAVSLKTNASEPVSGLKTNLILTYPEIIPFKYRKAYVHVWGARRYFLGEKVCGPDLRKFDTAFAQFCERLSLLYAAK